MPRIDTTTHISAPPHVVADIFFDFDSYPRWNPLIRSLTPHPTHPDLLLATLQMGPSYSPLLTEPRIVLRTPTELIWRGQILHPWFLSTEHRFFADEDDGGTIWVQSERFGGLVGWFFVLVFGRTVKRSFGRMNERLKELAETYKTVLGHFD
ncbi:hypothetical protein EXIGLDRAFT_722251 [Exidia glandulosa HHB12029]|uniref:Coenzyme Q-binding protein COQ10 START domain-containing protein n=1 Tax=Exidia glandulosa HHB12029 TaxID=1314781 RepID=A0A165FD91_EXIGL|nr:hypothetical protein EXIGLDRAFT_722251 [Exidia glandulosa HHB12029]